MPGVIKSGQPLHRSKADPQQFSLGDFILEGQQILAVARTKAEALVAEARRAADAHTQRITQEAHRKGHEAGFARGLEEGRQAGHREALAKATAEFQARHIQIASACEAIFREVDRTKAELMRAAHRDLLELGVVVAERVTKRIGLVDPHTVTDNLRAVIDRIGGSTDLVVETNPADAQTVRDFAPELLKGRTELKHVEVKENAAVGPGGCLVHSRGGRIDATIETQLQRIAEELIPNRSTASETPAAAETPPAAPVADDE